MHSDHDERTYGKKQRNIFLDIHQMQILEKKSYHFYRIFIIVDFEGVSRGGSRISGKEIIHVSGMEYSYSYLYSYLLEYFFFSTKLYSVLSELHEYMYLYLLTTTQLAG